MKKVSTHFIFAIALMLGSFLMLEVAITPNYDTSEKRQKSIFSSLDHQILKDNLKAQVVDWSSGYDSIINITEGGNDSSWQSQVSGNGNTISFTSSASNLVPNDTNSEGDIFVYNIQTGEMIRVSVDSNGVEANGQSQHAYLSEDGNIVVFKSWASNLVLNDTNNKSDVFIHNIQTGETTRVSVSSEGEQGIGFHGEPSISNDGNIVAFSSTSSNLVLNDMNVETDVFVHNFSTGETDLISVDSNGVGGIGNSGNPYISGDGNVVVFTSNASNLVLNDNNENIDTFVHNIQTGETVRVSVDSEGNEDNGSSSYAEGSISGDGNVVTFTSWSSNLVSNDNNSFYDVFVHNIQTGETILVSVDLDGFGGNNDSQNGVDISEDGNTVTFSSDATNLVLNDTNYKKDTFVRNIQTEETTRVSVGSNEVDSDGHSIYSSTSSLGEIVSFHSWATNLTENDNNSEVDIFLTSFLLPCPWDLDGNNWISASDLLIFLGQFGSTGNDLSADFNSDGIVNITDLFEFLPYLNQYCSEIVGVQGLQGTQYSSVSANMDTSIYFTPHQTLLNTNIRYNFVIKTKNNGTTLKNLEISNIIPKNLNIVQTATNIRGIKIDSSKVLSLSKIKQNQEVIIYLDLKLSDKVCSQIDPSVIDEYKLCR
jgi:hypothetical protein